MHKTFFQILGKDTQYDFIETWDTTAMDDWVIKTIGLSRCKEETMLFETKWFDYRSLHPLMATCLFTEAYKRQYANIMLTHGRDDFASAPFRTGLKRIPYIEQSVGNRTSLWKARQIADQYCVSYDYFIGTVLSAAATRLWDQLPRPQHLWQEELIEIFEDKFEKRKRTRLDESLLSYGTLGMVQGGYLQQSYYDWILKQLGERDGLNRILAIYSAVWLLELIPKDLAQQHFPRETMEAAAFH
jgi:hypothetical protein